MENFKEYQRKLLLKKQEEQNQIIKVEQERKEMTLQHRQKIQEKDNTIKDLEIFNLDAPPIVNIVVLEIEKLLTDKYNNTVVKEIKNFQVQLAKDLSRLPVIDPNLLRDEEGENGKGPIDLMRDELKNIGQASIKKD